MFNMLYSFAQYMFTRRKNVYPYPSAKKLLTYSLQPKDSTEIKNLCEGSFPKE